jgi:hypothetical protein
MPDDSERLKKMPKGTTRNPWYRVSEFNSKGEVVRHFYFLFTRDGIWKETKIPKDAVVKDW